MQLKSSFYIVLLYATLSCSPKQETPNSQKSASATKSSTSDSILATWISHSIHSSQILELRDSTNAVVYWFRDGNQQLKDKPYFFKAVGKVSQWNKIQLTIQTDKYNFYYNIWGDTLILRDEVGIIEKLVRVTNDTVGRSGLKIE